jgi:hypothetical protein
MVYKEIPKSQLTLLHSDLTPDQFHDAYTSAGKALEVIRDADSTC